MQNAQLPSEAEVLIVPLGPGAAVGIRCRGPGARKGVLFVRWHISKGLDHLVVLPQPHELQVCFPSFGPIFEHLPLLYCQIHKERADEGRW